MKSKIRNYILIGVVSVLAISSIAMTIETATSGNEMSKLERTRRELINQKEDLEESLVKAMSLGELQEKSLDLGFTKPQDLVYITPGEAVAKLP
jgi:hypothetical protein